MRASPTLGLGLVLFTAIACGGNAERSPGDGDDEAAESGRGGSGGASTVGGTGARADARGGKPGAGPTQGGAENGGATGVAGSTLGNAGALLGNGGATSTDDSLSPGEAVGGTGVVGPGSCASRTVGELVKIVHGYLPELADIANVYDPAQPGDGSFVYAFPKRDGFRLVFVRGSGDCPAGCINHEYWYFETAADCYPKFVGQYSWTYDSSGNCFAASGKPLWDFPSPPPPMSCSDTSQVPAQVDGSYMLVGLGQELACSSTSGNPTSATKALSLLVRQDPTNPGAPVVVLDGTGNPRIDGKEFEGRLTGSMLDVTTSATTNPELPACVDFFALSLSFDFQTNVGVLHMEEALTQDCAGDPSKYCKGYLDFKLSSDGLVLK